MGSLVTVFILVLAFLAETFVFSLLGENKPFCTNAAAVFNTVCFWIIINILSIFTKIRLPFSLLSLGVAVVCGIPGILFLTALKVIL